MENKRFKLAMHLKELGAIFQRICLEEIPFKDIMVITKGWKPNRKFKLLEERETRIRENKATIQAIEEQLNHTKPTLIPSGSQVVDQPNSPVASNNSGNSITAEPDRSYSDSFRLKGSRPNKISSGFTPFRNHKIGGQESPFFAIPCSCQGKKRIQREKQDLFWPQEERIRPEDPEGVGLGERSTKVPEIVVNTSRISSPRNRDITPNQNEHKSVTPESTFNSDHL
ncbi:hypothetical protein O181_036351 [Austropuccinia psidii MF-1]|uniref:Uncharacterized protein n=1 Tax=Austropuccinia psidii MF-1 TaxID=1389203 RepID=A0A9Q3D497_9BASI|nr:hypothetical protein [Austropuccinia psidii MF-1]